MRRLTIGFSVAAFLALAGCDGGSTPADREKAPAAKPDPIQARLEAMPEAQRNAVFIRAIRDANGECQHVESSQGAGEYQGLPLWRARCEGDSSFTIVITSGGSAQVLDDSERRLADEAGARPSEER